MRISTKAALLSGLVFPGLGHLVVKQYLRGAILISLALASTVVILRQAMQQAQDIVDRIVSGEIPLETGAISEQVANASNGSGGMLVNISFFVFFVCWLFGMVDSYRLGRAQDVVAIP